MKKVYITAIKRTAIGSFLGQFAQCSSVELGAQLLQQMIDAGQIPVEVIDEVIIGSVLTAGHGQNIARQIAVKAGLSNTIPAYTVNMVCGSGLKAVYEGYAKIKAGLNQALIVGGVESMSQAAYLMPNTSRSGNKLGNMTMVDSLLKDGLTDAFEHYHMGITAENLAEKYQISREMQDEFAYQSQLKAREAQQLGKFQEEIMPITLTTRRGEMQVIDQDEYINYKTTLEKLATLRPAFQKDGTVTAGNASGINDGAALLCLVSEEIVDKYQLTPLAEVLSFGQSGVDPSIMGIGPVAAVGQALERASLPLTAIDRFELNEAFAVQALAVEQLLAQEHQVSLVDLQAKTNVNGGAIALGHPIGMSGARILTTLVHELQREQLKYGVASLCIGGGMGIAAVIKIMTDEAE